MSRYSIVSASGEVKYSGTPTYHGTYLKPGYLEFANIPKTAVVSWQIGDRVYYDRTDRNYYLFDIPNVEKLAGSGLTGESYVYRSVQFYDITKWMERAPFRDLVSGSGNYYFSSEDGVHTMNELVSGLADRLTRNMNNFVGADTWLFVVPNDLDEKYEVDVAKEFSVDGSVLDALDAIYNTWNNLGWWYKYENGKNTIIFGDDPTPAFSGTLSYKEGLLSLKRTQTDLDNYATRLYVYGSDRNMPNRFYNKQNIYQKDNVYIPHLMLPISRWGKTSNLPDASKAYFDNGGSAKIYRTIRFDGSDNEEIYPSIEKATIGYLREALQSGDAYYPEDTWNDADRIDEVYQVVSMPTDTGHDAIDAVKADHGSFDQELTVTFPGYTQYWSYTTVLSTFDSSLSVGNSLICDFPSPENALLMYIAVADEERIQHILSLLNVTLELTKDGESIYSQPLTLKDVTGNIGQVYAKFPSFSLASGGGVYSLSLRFEYLSGLAYPSFTIIPVVNTDIKWTLKNSKISYFDLRFRQLGFDPNACVGNCVMSMKSGMCAGREFSMRSIRYDSATDTWIARLARYQDTSISTYFPNSELPIRAGDEFVFTGIEMPDIYVHAQAARMYDIASAIWEQLQVPAYTYEPQIDSKYIFENLPGEYPLEGRLLTFDDNNILPSAQSVSSLLQSVTICEEGDIPRINLTISDVRAQSVLKDINGSISHLTSIVVRTGKNSKVAIDNLSENIENIGGDISLVESKFNGNKAKVAEVADRVAGRLTAGSKVYDGSDNVSITPTDLDLGNVDNTHDVDKPISIATQAALDAKFDKAGGIIFNDSDGSPIKIKAKRADDRASASIPFLDGNEAKIGEIGVKRLSGGVIVPYFAIDNFTLNAMFHEGNANKETIDWVCKILSAVNVNASGDIVANGGVSAHGITDLSVSGGGVGVGTVLRYDELTTSEPEDTSVVATAYSVAKIKEDIGLNDIEEFITNRPYERGDVVRYNGKGWRFVTNKEPGSWDPSYCEYLRYASLAKPLPIQINEIKKLK